MSKKILIVEDNELNMKLFHDLLEVHGYTTIQTKDGHEALQLAREHRPDLILMDIQLPEISGLEVTKWIKSDESLKSIPIIAVTAFAMKGDEEKIKRGGCEAYIAKPISVANFLQTIERFWDNGQMSARVLVVDDIPANVRLLAAKLHSEYYEVITAASGEQALAAVEKQAPDIVLLDVMMPGMDGFEVCRRLKANPLTAHVPVVMVTALSEASDRVRGLDAGADDFLTKPANDVVLFARVRSLVRMKRAGDEWRMREATLMRFAGSAGATSSGGTPAMARVLVAIDDCELSDLIEETLRSEGHRVIIARDPDEAAAIAQSEELQLVLSDSTLAGQDALRFCSLLRSGDRTRHWPILLIVQDADIDRLAKALELGVSDYLVRPVIRGELIARVRAQLRRKWNEDGLRKTYERSVAAAVTDGLTGLNNRRFFETHYAAIERDLAVASKPISLLMLDVDRFKEVNDNFGHTVGDDVLKGLAQRIQSLIRGFDTAARFGGEEFVILMPNTPKASAVAAAGRLCRFLGDAPYPVSGKPGELAVTVSIGVATIEAGKATLDELIRLADGALYRAKRAGRNRYEVAGDGETAEAPGAQERRATG